MCHLRNAVGHATQNFWCHSFRNFLELAKFILCERRGQTIEPHYTYTVRLYLEPNHAYTYDWDDGIALILLFSFILNAFTARNPSNLRDSHSGTRFLHSLSQSHSPLFFFLCSSGITCCGAFSDWCFTIVRVLHPSSLFVFFIYCFLLFLWAPCEGAISAAQFPVSKSPPPAFRSFFCVFTFDPVFRCSRG